MPDPFDETSDQLLSEILLLEDEIDKILSRKQNDESSESSEDDDIKKYREFIDTKQNILNGLDDKFKNVGSSLVNQKLEDKN